MLQEQESLETVDSSIFVSLDDPEVLNLPSRSNPERQYMIGEAWEQLSRDVKDLVKVVLLESDQVLDLLKKPKHGGSTICTKKVRYFLYLCNWEKKKVDFVLGHLEEFVSKKPLKMRKAESELKLVFECFNYICGLPEDERRREVNRLKEFLDGNGLDGEKIISFLGENVTIKDNGLKEEVDMSKKRDRIRQIDTEETKAIASKVGFEIKTGSKPDHYKEELVKHLEQLPEDDKVLDDDDVVRWYNIAGLLLDGKVQTWEQAAEIENGKAPTEEKERAVASTTKKSDKKKGPSTKQLVYKDWKKAGGKVDYAELDKKYPVKLTTIRGWCNSWKHGKNLPAGV